MVLCFGYLLRRLCERLSKCHEVTEITVYVGRTRILELSEVDGQTSPSEVRIRPLMQPKGRDLTPTTPLLLGIGPRHTPKIHQPLASAPKSPFAVDKALVVRLMERVLDSASYLIYLLRLR